MEIRCPKCGRQYAVNESMVGKTAKCAGCGEAFRVTKAPQGQPGVPPVPVVAEPPHARSGGARIPLVLMAGVLILAVGVAGGIAVHSLLSKGGDGKVPRAGGTDSPRDLPARVLTREEISQWSERVDKELRILKVAAPGSVRLLAEKPESIHVVHVTRECTADTFGSDEVGILKKWVENGGIVWAENDVVSLFGIKYQSRSLGAMPYEWVPGSTPGICPILTGCTQVSWSLLWNPQQTLLNLSAKGVIPLLSTNDGTCCWSLVPYGRGWVSDIKPLQPDKYDGARFWLHFRMFCVGWPIPGSDQK